MSNIALIQPQRQDFDTTQITDWLDGLPMIGTPSLGGTLAGAANVGNGGIAVASVGAGTPRGVHVVTVSAVALGLARISATAPDGTLTASGAVGLPFYAGGITLALTQGSTPFAVGDSFAIAVVPAPVDITGLQFDLDARMSISSVSIALQATSGGQTPTIANGGTSGTIAMTVPRATMARVPVKPEGYPYSITATDPVSGLKVPAFYGLIYHTALPAQIGSA